MCRACRGAIALLLTESGTLPWLVAGGLAVV